MKFKIHKQYRLPEFDYSSNNSYFITICTKDRIHHFGEISNSTMYLTEIAVEAQSLIDNANKKLEHLMINEYTIMPNHIHLLITLHNKEYEPSNPKNGLYPLVSKSIPSFINHFKGKLKRWSNENNFGFFEWQKRYHDRIIRDQHEYCTIKNYIKNNVKNWDNDEDNI